MLSPTCLTVNGSVAKMLATQSINVPFYGDNKEVRVVACLSSHLPVAGAHIP